MVVSFVWETAEYVTDGPYASLPPTHFLAICTFLLSINNLDSPHQAKNGGRPVNQDGNLANGYCCFVFLLASFLVWVMARGASCPFPSRRGLGHDGVL